MSVYNPEDARLYRHRDPSLYQAMWAFSAEGAAQQYEQYHGRKTRSADWRKVSDDPPPAPPRAT